MAEENNTPVEETVEERAKRKLADAENPLFAPPSSDNSKYKQFDGAIGQVL